MSIEYCFNCDARYDTDFEEWCPRCEENELLTPKTNQLKELGSLFKGIHSEMQVMCDDYRQNHEGR